jgi:hypothetical protein
VSAEHTFNRTTLVVAITLMFVLFKHTHLFDDPNYELLALAASILTGTGLHEALARAIEIVVNHNQLLKKLVLGNSFLEGKWSGFYVADAGHINLFLLTIRQEWSRVYLNGQVFTKESRPYGQGHDVYARVDGQSGRLQGVFSSYIIGGHYDTVFSLQLEGRPPIKLRGYWYDTSTSTTLGRAWTYLVRLPESATQQDAVARAQEVYAGCWPG